MTGDNLWEIDIFGSRNEDGSGPRYLERDLTLSQAQADQDLAVGGTTPTVLPFNGLAVSLLDFFFFFFNIVYIISNGISFSKTIYMSHVAKQYFGKWIKIVPILQRMMYQLCRIS